MERYNTVVIGGGAAGMMAALTAAEGGCRTLLLEKNEKLGKKIYITGKGRCNFTNACDLNTFISNVVTNPKFMYSSLRAFDPQDMIGLLEDAGCRTKVERGNRAFPVSDHASDVTAALARKMRAAGVDVRLEAEVGAVTSECDPAGFSVRYKDIKTGKEDVVHADSVIIATGGLSYPSTGSTGDGYAFAEDMGLKVNASAPALVPLEAVSADQAECAALQGVSLKNVSFRLLKQTDVKTETIYEDGPGELLFTHFGLSGPLVLSASSAAAGILGDFRGMQGKGGRPETDGMPGKGGRPETGGTPGSATKPPIIAEIDLKPGLHEEKLEERILRDFEERSNMTVLNGIGKLLISSLRPLVLRRAGINADKKVREITKEERRRLVRAIKHLDFGISGTRGFQEAIITHGGVDVSEIHPKTMESRKVPGLYFAGEVLDVDAYTGGFNLQIAWSTGYAAGCAAARR